MTEEIDLEWKSAIFGTSEAPWPWPWIGTHDIPSCITHRRLSTYQISLKSEKLFVDGWMDGRTYVWTFQTPSNTIRSTRRNQLERGLCPSPGKTINNSRIHVLFSSAWSHVIWLSPMKLYVSPVPKCLDTLAPVPICLMDSSAQMLKCPGTEVSPSVHPPIGLITDRAVPSSVLSSFSMTTVILTNNYGIKFFHQIHPRQHAFTANAGTSKHRLWPYNAYYHNWQTLNFTASSPIQVQMGKR